MPKKNKISRNFSWLRLAKRSFFAIFALVILSIGGSAIFVRSNYHQPKIEHKNCAVVFGAAVWKNDIPSHALYDRTSAGISLLKNKQVDCLIFSGGKSKYGAHEADVMKKIALQKNISSKDIFLDYDGNNTWQTIKNTQENFAEKSLVFVSNDFHLARIKLLAHQQKIKNFALYPAPYHNGKYFKNNYFFWREVAGVLYYLVF